MTEKCAICDQTTNYPIELNEKLYCSSTCISKYRDEVGEAPGHLGLHAHKGIPSPDLQLLPPPPHALEFRFPVNRDRMVYGRHRWKPQPLNLQKSVGKALIVVDDVELPYPLLQEAVGTEPEGAWLRKTSGRDTHPLEDIGR